MILFIDIETTGLPEQELKSDGRKHYYPFNNYHKYDNSRIVQFSFLLYEKNGTMLEQHDYIIKPNNFIIPAESTKIHHITQEYALDNGIDINEAMNIFEEILEKTKLIVMHNTWFDKTIILSEASRLQNQNVIDKMLNTNYFCTMRDTKNILKIPSQYYNGYKNPKLTELHNFLFQKTIDPKYLHNSLNDAKITAKCFFKLLKKGLIH